MHHIHTHRNLQRMLAFKVWGIHHAKIVLNFLLKVINWRAQNTTWCQGAFLAWKRSWVQYPGLKYVTVMKQFPWQMGSLFPPNTRRWVYWTKKTEILSGLYWSGISTHSPRSLQIASPFLYGHLSPGAYTAVPDLPIGSLSRSKTGFPISEWLTLQNTDTYTDIDADR